MSISSISYSEYLAEWTTKFKKVSFCMVEKTFFAIFISAF